ncbi:MAG: hypothetical protein GYB65_20250, partial [Chloroflexi bacterium]|nr:hypothetical protein [Chloroflexota bacterium]
MHSTPTVCLTMPCHDPEGRLYRQFEAHLPTLLDVFDAVTAHAKDITHAGMVDLLIDAGVEVRREPDRRDANGIPLIGAVRRSCLQLALETGASWVLYCDSDRALHWAEHYPDELAEVATQIRAYDFTVIGRTERAFTSHPRIQRDTEAIINHVYGLLSGTTWDITAATRGLSRPAAEAILAQHTDDTFGVDATWPLFI